MQFTEQSGDDSVASSVDLHILSINECFVYKVPPLRSASGHRAEDWGLEHPLFTGGLKVYQNDQKLRILLYRYIDPSKLSLVDDNIVFFGECPVVVKPGENVTHFVDAVIDSSRYYVLRIKDPRSERSTLIGIGFRERDQAFDFKSALNEYVKYVDRMHRAERMRAGSIDSDGESSSASEEVLPSVHLDEHIAPLKEGEKIKVNIRLHNKNKPIAATTPSTPPAAVGSPLTTAAAGVTGSPHLHPLRVHPPTSGTITTALETHVMVRPPSFRGAGMEGAISTDLFTVPQSSALDDEDWGDFTSSAP